MSTSGVNTFAVTRDDIIRMAMLNIGKLEQSEVPTPQETTDCAMFLNMLVKQWQGTTDFAPGLKTWTRRRGYLYLHSATGKYTLGPAGVGWTLTYNSTVTTANAAAGQAVLVVSSNSGMTVNDYFGVEVASGDLVWSTIKTIVGTTITLNTNLSGAVGTSAVVYTYTTPATQPLKIEYVNLRDTQMDDTPVRIMTNLEYDSLPAKVTPTNISDPSGVYYEFQLGNSYLYTDVAGAQDVTKYLVITYLESEQDFVNPLDNPEYPQEWYLPLALNLSKLIAPMFHAAWTPAMDENAKLALAIAQKKEPERIVAYFQAGNVDL